MAGNPMRRETGHRTDKAPPYRPPRARRRRGRRRSGLGCDAVMRLSQQRVPLAELDRASGACLGTRRLLAIRQALGAHHALLHQRGRAIPLVFGHIERTGGHAIPAADASFGVIDHRTFGHLLQGSHRADGDAGRFQAVHALALDEPPRQPPPALNHLVELDQAPGVGGQVGRVGADRAEAGRSAIRSLLCLQATWHPRQPMHLVVSIRSP